MSSLTQAEAKVLNTRTKAHFPHPKLAPVRRPNRLASWKARLTEHSNWTTGGAPSQPLTVPGRLADDA